MDVYASLRKIEFELCGGNLPEKYKAFVRRVLNDRNLIPAADVVPVVRCKDCEHAERYERADGTAGYYCGHPQNTFTYGERWDRVFKPVKEPNGFCSKGKRKDGADAEG